MTGSQRIEIALRASLLASTILQLQHHDDGLVLKLTMQEATKQFMELDKKIKEVSK